MKRFMHVFRVDLLRSLTSPRFYSLIFITCALYAASAWNEMKMLTTPASVLYYFRAVNTFNSLMDILLIGGVLPFALSFCEDWANRYITPVLIRANISNYGWSKITVCFISTFLAVFVGILLFFGMAAISSPIILPGDVQETNADILSLLLVNHRPWLYLCGMSMIKATSIAFWSVFALACSSYLKNIFYTIIAPLVGYRVYVSVYFFLKFPPYLGLQYLGEGLVNLGNTAFSFLYALFVYIALSVLLGAIFVHQVRRNIANA